jgi:hypothetical protein
MSGFDGPLLAAGMLLVVTGAVKVLRPEPTVGALRSVGVHAGRTAVRAGALVEAGVGATVVLVGGVASDVMVAALYAGFSCFLVAALRRGGLVSSCGCAGRPDTPPTWTHLALTSLAAAAAAAAAVAGGHNGLLSLSIDAHAVAVLLFAAFTTWLSWLVLAALPRLRAPSAP